MQPASRGPKSALRSVLRLTMFAALGLVALIISAQILPRVVWAVAAGLVIFFVGTRYFQSLGVPVPEPEPEKVNPGFGLTYVCEMCGMELAVRKVAREKAPKHCGEEMKLIQIDDG